MQCHRMSSFRLRRRPDQLLKSCRRVILMKELSYLPSGMSKREDFVNLRRVDPLGSCCRKSVKDPWSVTFLDDFSGEDSHQSMASAMPMDADEGNGLQPRAAPEGVFKCRSRPARQKPCSDTNLACLRSAMTVFISSGGRRSYMCPEQTAEGGCPHTSIGQTEKTALL